MEDFNIETYRKLINTYDELVNFSTYLKKDIDWGLDSDTMPQNVFNFYSSKIKMIDEMSQKILETISEMKKFLFDPKNQNKTKKKKIDIDTSTSFYNWDPLKEKQHNDANKLKFNLDEIQTNNSKNVNKLKFNLDEFRK